MGVEPVGKGALALACAMVACGLRGADPETMSRAGEAQLNLRQIAQAAQVAFHRERVSPGGAFQQAFPAGAPLTPDRDCCSFREGGKCPYDEAAWMRPGWMDLGWSPGGAHYFRYEFVSSGTGLDATFTARAIGDLDCDGTTSTWEITGRVLENGNPTVSDQTRTTRAYE